MHPGDPAAQVEWCVQTDSVRVMHKVITRVVRLCCCCHLAHTCCVCICTLWWHRGVASTAPLNMALCEFLLCGYLTVFSLLLILRNMVVLMPNSGATV